MRFLLYLLFILLASANAKVIRHHQTGDERIENEATALELKGLGGLRRAWNPEGWNNMFVDAYGCPQSTDYVCNLHNPKFNCTCFRPNQISPIHYPSCDEVFHVQNVRAYVIELKTMVPRNADFIDKFDVFLAELIEDFCAIDQKYLIILRKRCFAGDMLIQIAFLRATDKPLPDRIGIAELQAVHPSIFLQNKDFMEQTYLPILNVSEVDFLTPVIRRPGEPIIHGMRYKPEQLEEPEKPEALISGSFEFGYIVLFGFILMAANLIPMCLLWRIVSDRRTKDSSPNPAKLTHL